jgi:hypothetical protein
MFVKTKQSEKDVLINISDEIIFKKYTSESVRNQTSSYLY